MPARRRASARSSAWRRFPAVRRQGLGGAVTGALVEDALARGATTVFLTAGSEDIARVYGRLGFRRIGSALRGGMRPRASGCAHAPRRAAHPNPRALRHRSPHRRDSPRQRSRGAVNERPIVAGVLGALVIAFSAILVDLADVAPATAAFWRCAYALPLLGLLAWSEHRRFGARTWRERRLAFAAGVLFAIDMVVWHYAIRDVGAGLATVLGNLQVVIVPFVALAVLGERVPRAILYALPLVCTGVLLVSGALEDGAYGANPGRGVLLGVATGLAYSAFLLVQRQGSQTCAASAVRSSTCRSSRRSARSPSGRDRRRRPRARVAERGLAGHAGGHVTGPRLAAIMVAAAPAGGHDVDDLTIQPIALVALGAIPLGQDPSVLYQFGGVFLILSGLVSVAIRPTGPRATDSGYPV